MRNIDVINEKRYVRMKPEVYEHLARTFLEKKKNKNNKKQPTITLFVSLGLLIAILVFIFVLFLTREKIGILQRSLHILLDKSPITIAYNFKNPGTDKVKAMSFSLSDIDISRYRFLDFRARLIKKTTKDSVIKVEIENAFKEKASTYLNGITWQWKRFSLPLSDFKKISDKTVISSISFVIEDWNLSDKENSLIIDEVRFTK